MDHFLKHVGLFADLPPEDLDRLCEKVDTVTLEQGEVLFEEGAAGDRAYIVERGEIDITKRQGEREVLLAVRRSGDVIGEMSLLEEAPRIASARARSAALLHAIDHATLHALVAASATAARVMFYTVLGRWKATAATLRQSERMAQLGTLTAGVAHELNNPAAAVGRSAEQLSLALAEAEEAVRALGAMPVDDALLAPLRDAPVHRAEPLSALDRSDREQALEDVLSAAGVPEPWTVAPDLVDLGLEPDAIGALLRALPPDSLPVVTRWLATRQAVRALLAEVGEGARRISQIVLALKQYSFLDQAPVQDVDLHEGLDNTLLILKHKLGPIAVRRDYAPDLPRIEAHGSELNQVWTNLLDNAIDALEGKGTITLRTRFDDRSVYVDVADDGPGIPEEIQSRVFDAFFTTKPPGKGTGQGLDIVWRIVVDHHGGLVQLRSHPGSTVFTVVLPRRPGGPVALAAARTGGTDVQDRILAATKTIAVVGITDRGDQPSNRVPAYLQQAGYRIVPVNPKLESVLGERAVPDLRSVGEPIDTVLVFRRGEAVPPIVEDAIALGAKAVWMQSGIVNEEAADRAREAGLEVVMDTCMRTSHRRWVGSR